MIPVRRQFWRRARDADLLSIPSRQTSAAAVDSNALVSYTQNMRQYWPFTRGPIYKISYYLSWDYLKFIVRSTYDNDSQRT